MRAALGSANPNTPSKKILPSFRVSLAFQMTYASPLHLQESFVRCMVDRGVAAEEAVGCWAALSEEQQASLLALRGLLAMRVLLHCLEKRHLVDFGVNR